ncbi:uncharacterized protein LOC127245476 isoform X2 [Andrographis paniculata]|uniref:uncharacterized protein LOC127245476 isoform X2 n=1 Tax=Andrographis paniculata TaxID=175694 RepID=UPI0021E75105|nr:uncharacterized protein LOC127245476 isoform X2 [Andrographis paniculata]XP_051122341.1 uncharacterized protein LOC127245476 isoform X2 [Andrographis paniculata]
MATQKVNLAVVIKNLLDNTEFLLQKQTPPPKFDDPEYDSYQDSDLWDLPSGELSLLESPRRSIQVQIDPEGNSMSEFLNRFDLDFGLTQVFGQVGFEKATSIKWSFSKVVEEPEFGPGVPVKTVYIFGELESYGGELKDGCKWVSIKGCEELLLEVKTHDARIGPLIVDGLLNDSMQLTSISIPSSLRYQEYPPGVKLFPMSSRTASPFHTTNLVVFSPAISNCSSDTDSSFASGDALIVDPGCNSSMYKELEQIVTALPRKLVVFVTHHHHDHVHGLSIVQKYSPDAILMAHEHTFRRIRKDDWSLGYIPVLGSEEICIGGQRLKLISAPVNSKHCLSLIIHLYFLTIFSELKSIDYRALLVLLHEIFPYKAFINPRFCVDVLEFSLIINNFTVLILSHNLYVVLLGRTWVNLLFCHGILFSLKVNHSCFFMEKYFQGHTDGHMALLHVSTNSLIVGDHCVGQGSAILDITSGGNMTDYFQTTYKFIEMSPHVLIPMHGRLNVWPKHMLCGYLKNRRSRESTILKAIEEGAKTLYDIVAYTYAGVDRSLWAHAASNVRLHVDHLASLNKLPKDFSVENFKGSVGEFHASIGKM